MGVLATVIGVGRLAPARRPGSVPPALSVDGSLRKGSKLSQRFSPSEPLLRYEVPFKSLPLPPWTPEIPCSAEAIRLPALTSDMRLRARFSDDERMMDRLETALSPSDTTSSWMAVLGDWFGGRQGGLGLFVPKWSACPQLIAHGEAATGWGMGLQYRQSF